MRIPVRVELWHPTPTWHLVHTYLFGDASGVSKADASTTFNKTGGDDIDDLEAMLNAGESIMPAAVSKSQTTPTTKVESVVAADRLSTQSTQSTLYIYPEDNFMDVKNKIYVASGIPIYRQYLFYLRNGESITTHMLTVDGTPYDLDIRTEVAADLGLPIDKFLVDSRETLSVAAMDTNTSIAQAFSISAAPLPTIVMYLVDLKFYIAPVTTQLAARVRDAYDFGAFYYGFIVKYWPMLTYEIFTEYVLDEHEITHNYPEIARSRTDVADTYRIERDIIDDKYKQASKCRQMPLAITRALAYIDNAGVILHLRNLFDSLATSIHIPEIRYYDKDYLCRKIRVGCADVLFPSLGILKSGILLAIAPTDVTNRFIFMSIQLNGTVYISAIAHEKDELDFDGMADMIATRINPTLAFINAAGATVFIRGRNLSLVNESVLLYQTIDVGLYWKKMVTSGGFKIVKAAWEPYLRSRLVAARGVHQFEKYELLFRKGMTEFDSAAVERTFIAAGINYNHNQYSYLSSVAAKQKWDQNYEGRLMQIILRTADIKFEVTNIHRAEFHIFKQYIEHFVYTVETSAAFKSAAMTQRETQYSDVQRLRKLQEEDPELYDLKRHGSLALYSRLCQSNRQPLIFTDDEYKKMSAADRAKATEYWNFTTQRAAYYKCIHKSHPVLDFIIGKHPKNWCIPCCGKRSTASKEAARVCHKSHTFVRSTPAASNHALHYTKLLSHGRISKLPTALAEYLNSDGTFYVFGVTQQVGLEMIGALTAICAVLDISPAEFVAVICDALGAGVKLSDYIETYFRTSEQLRIVLTQLVRNVDTLSAGRTVSAANLTNHGQSHKVNTGDRGDRVVNDGDRGDRGVNTGDRGDRGVNTGDRMVNDGDTVSVMPSEQSSSVRHISSGFDAWPEFFIEAARLLYNLYIFTFVDGDGTGAKFSLYASAGIRETFTLESRAAIFVKKRNEYYPVFQLSPREYFSSRTMIARSWKFDSTGNNETILLLASALAAGVKHDENPCALAKILEFIKACPQYVVARQFISSTNNKVYALMLTDTLGAGDRNIYMPVLDSAPLVGVRHGERREGSAAALIDFVHQYNGWAANNAGGSIIFQAKLYAGSAFLGYTVNSMVAYCDDSAIPPYELPSRDVIYDPRDVDKAIDCGTAADSAGQQYVFEGLYSANIYSLFVLAFATYLLKQRNDAMRTAVRAIMADKVDSPNISTSAAGQRANVSTKTGDKVKKLRGLGLSNSDIKQLIAAGSISDDAQYEFDNMLFNELRAKANVTSVSEALLAIVSNFAIEREFDMRSKPFNNILQQNPVCHSGAILMVHPSVVRLPVLCDKLARDICDPIRSQFLLVNIWRDNYINFLEFVKRPGEKIIFYPR